jgi:phosphoribosylformimino-5-aminoimidazole carboxamide ribotide isomerase
MVQLWFNGPIEVIPAVDVLGNEAVRLRRGSYDDVVERAADPAALAASWHDLGAGRIHLVDLEGARSGRVRPELVRRVAAACAPLPVQASGGIRSASDARALLAAGADRVVVGTAAWPDPAPWVEELGDALVVAVDVRDGRLRTSGWTRDEGLTVRAALDRANAAGVQRCLVTAIDRDGTLAGPDLELVALAAGTGLAVLAAGGIR